MLKKALIGTVVLVLVAAVSVFVLARSILATDTVRIALAGQISKAIGQPVTIKTISATIYPRITVNLGEVGIGAPERIRVRTLEVGTDFRALLSRQIAHANLRLNGGRIELPLPVFNTPADAPASAGPPSASPVEIVSIDEIVLKDVEIVGGGHTLRAEIEVVPAAKGLTLRKIALAADNTTITGTGQITDLVGPVGELTLKSDALSFERLMAFATDFARSAGLGDASKPATGSQVKEPRAARAQGMNIAVSIDAGRATFGRLVLDHLTATAHVTGQNVALDPARFGLFRGRYEGTMVLALGDTPDFRLKASLAGVDMTDAMTFAGSPDTMTGKLSGRIDLAGRGADVAAITKSARGTVRVDIRDGTVKNLGLVQAVVLATSMRTDGKSPLSGGSKDEPFSLLGATLKVASGVATTDDLHFESPNLSLNAAGSVSLTSNIVDLKGKIQLSDALSQQAGRDLVRYTQEQGRVTLPATVTGPAASLSARIDVGDVAQRAVKNRANEEVQKALKKGLGGFLR